jgi:hypothetical protein
MTPKDFLVKFILAVVLFSAAVYALTYFQIREYESVPVPEQAVILPDSGSESAVPEAPAQEKPAVELKNGPKIDNPHTIDKYPVSYSAGGNLKMIAPDFSWITIGRADNDDTRAIVTDTTEVFYNGARAEISAIKGTDQVTILGRKSSEDSAEFVADTIYANSTVDTPAPFTPSDVSIDQQPGEVIVP